MPFDSAQDLLSNLTSPYRQDGVGTNADLADATFTAVWQEWSTLVPLARGQLKPATAAGAYLDKWAEFYGLSRAVGESDPNLRIRVAGKLNELFGDVTYNGLLQLVATLTSTDASDVTVIENRNANDTGHEPAVIELQVDTDQMLSNGILPSELAGAVENAQTAADNSAAAGVKVRVVAIGGAAWDDPVALWDDANTLFGS